MDTERSSYTAAVSGEKKDMSSGSTCKTVFEKEITLEHLTTQFRIKQKASEFNVELDTSAERQQPLSENKTEDHKISKDLLDFRKTGSGRQDCSWLK